jgi:small subunit ribosomal protein S20
MSGVEAEGRLVAPVQPASETTTTAVIVARMPARRPFPLMNPLVDSPTPMANIKSQKKRNIQNEKRHERNVATKSALKTSTKKVHAAAAAGDADAATTAHLEASRALDKAASRGILHKKTAARRKSRLAKAANAASA